MSHLSEILEATAASREGGFGAFARKNPRKRDPRETKRQKWQNPSRTKFDDIKDKFSQMRDNVKKRGEANVLSSSSFAKRRQAKIQKASDAAQAHIDQTGPRVAQQAQRDKAETQAHSDNRRVDRTMKKGEYEAERRKERDQQLQKRQPKKLVPLHQADESKVRQLAKRLNAAQAEQLGQMIGSLINPPKSEGTAEQVAKRR